MHASYPAHPTGGSVQVPGHVQTPQVQLYTSSIYICTAHGTVSTHVHVNPDAIRIRHEPNEYEHLYVIVQIFFLGGRGAAR